MMCRLLQACASCQQPLPSTYICVCYIQIIRNNYGHFGFRFSISSPRLFGFYSLRGLVCLFSFHSVNNFYLLAHSHINICKTLAMSLNRAINCCSRSNYVAVMLLLLLPKLSSAGQCSKKSAVKLSKNQAQKKTSYTKLFDSIVQRVDNKLDTTSSLIGQLTAYVTNLS